MGGCLAGCFGFAVLGALLVDGPGGDLLGAPGAGAAFDGTGLDVFVLAFTFVAPCGLRHDGLLSG